MTYTKRWELVHVLGGKCIDCAEENFYLLEIDHIYNDGDGERQFYNGFEKRYVSNPVRAKQRLVIRCKKCHETRHTVPKQKTQREIRVGRMRMTVELMKNLQKCHIEGIPEDLLVKELCLLGSFDPNEARNTVRLMLREACIFESQVGAYLLV